MNVRLQEHAAEREIVGSVDEALARASGCLNTTVTREVGGHHPRGPLFAPEIHRGQRRHVADIETLDELDRYTYLVAGCVGDFWTGMHLAHRPRLARWDRAAMTARGIRFGKALQMTNVLRDVPADLREGRCYIPARELASVGLTPRDLLDPAPARARPLLDRCSADAHAL